jgi:hypothetical protein
MSAAFLIVAVSEWLASRGRFVPPAVAFLPEDIGEPAPYVEAPAPDRSPPALEPGDDTEEDALTMIESPSAAAADPWEHGVVEDGEEPEPELAERGGMFRRRRR